MKAKTLNEGDSLPEFQLLSTSGLTITNKDTEDKNIIIFIYSKNDTSSCTKEAKSFSDCHQNFLDLDVKIFGVSRDTVASHKKFSSKYSLNLELLSDENAEFICNVGSWVEKSMYGKKYMGIDRTTILISKDGKVLKIWRKVRVPGHVPEVLNFVKEKFS